MVEDLHRQRIVKFLDAFYSGDIEGALACCNDDIDFVAHAPIDILPHMGHRHGKAEVAEMWKIVHARYSSMRHEIPMMVAEKDNVAATIRVFFRKRSNDRVVQIRHRGLLYPSRRPHLADSPVPGFLRSGAAGAGTRRRRRSDRQQVRARCDPGRSCFVAALNLAGRAATNLEAFVRIDGRIRF